jgi:hypothetical protein
MPITLNNSNISVQYNTGSNYIIETVKSDLYVRDTIGTTSNLFAEPTISPTVTTNIGVFTHSGGAENQTLHTIYFPESTVCEILIVGGGGAGGTHIAGGGGGGGVLHITNATIPKGTYNIQVGKGGDRMIHNPQPTVANNNGKSSIAFGIEVFGGGFGGNGMWAYPPGYVANNGGNGGSGGAGGSYNSGRTVSYGGSKVLPSYTNNVLLNGTYTYYGGSGGDGKVIGFQGGGSGGGGAGGVKPTSSLSNYDGADGIQINIDGNNYFWGGGGGGSIQDSLKAGNGGKGGGGGGNGSTGVSGYTPGSGGTGGILLGQDGMMVAGIPEGGNGGSGTGGGGGATSQQSANAKSGAGGSGIVIIKVISPTTNKYLFFNYLSTQTNYTLTFPVRTLVDVNNNNNLILQGQYNVSLETTNSSIIPSVFNTSNRLIPLPNTSTSNISVRYHLLNPIKTTEGAQWTYSSSNANVYHLGSVGIGTTSPEYSLDVRGFIYSSSGGYTSSALTKWSVLSDRRIKENIVKASYDKCLENVKNIELYNFNFKDNYVNTNDRHQLGFIAQEVQQVYPKAVEFSRMIMNLEEKIDDLLTLNTTQIDYTLYGAVKCLIQKLENIKIKMEQIKTVYNITT